MGVGLFPGSSWMSMVCRCSLYGLIICCMLQQSESSFVIPTTTTKTISTIISTRHVPVVIHHDHEHFNALSKWGRSGGFTTLSSHQQENIIDKEIIISTTNQKRRRTWEENFQLLVAYKEKHGTCHVPWNYKEDIRLSYWLNNQRKGINTLSADRREKLDAFDVSWRSDGKKRSWDKKFQLLISYKEKNGNCNVPTKYKQDPTLGLWVKTQRTNKGRLSDERIEKLEGLGFSWSNEIPNEQWEEMFQLLEKYAKENNGDCNVPGNNDNDVNKELFLWVTEQRKRKLLLPEERRTKLDTLGLIWEDSDKIKADHKWNAMYERLQEYKQKYGDCKVAQKWDEDPPLGRWVSRQRTFYREEVLPKDRQMKLEQINFSWRLHECPKRSNSKRDKKWNHLYDELLDFREEHGHCDVPRYYKENKSLAGWVVTQRFNQKKGTLRDDRKERLDEIGFTWTFVDQKEKQWRDKYKDLQHFKETNGHLRLPNPSVLSVWATEQRKLFATGKMTFEKKSLLDEIDFRWELQNSSKRPT